MDRIILQKISLRLRLRLTDVYVFSPVALARNMPIGTFAKRSKVRICMVEKAIVSVSY